MFAEVVAALVDEVDIRKRTVERSRFPVIFVVIPKDSFGIRYCLTVLLCCPTNRKSHRRISLNFPIFFIAFPRVPKEVEI